VDDLSEQNGLRLPSNGSHVSCEGATRQPPRSPKDQDRARRLTRVARPRQLQMLVRQCRGCDRKARNEVEAPPKPRKGRRSPDGYSTD
jgi:hypothetical protein